MRGLGRLENFNLGMGLQMTPGQTVRAPYASLDGLGELGDAKKYLLIVLAAITLYYLSHG